MLLAMAGSLFVRFGRLLLAWQIWTVTNGYFALHNACIGEWAQCAFFLGNMLISTSGWHAEHRKRERNDYGF